MKLARAAAYRHGAMAATSALRIIIRAGVLLKAKDETCQMLQKPSALCARATLLAALAAWHSALKQRAGVAS
jgi:hypothetical protein